MLAAITAAAKSGRHRVALAAVEGVHFSRPRPLTKHIPNAREHAYARDEAALGAALEANDAASALSRAQVAVLAMAEGRATASDHAAVSALYAAASAAAASSGARVSRIDLAVAEEQMLFLMELL